MTILKLPKFHWAKIISLFFLVILFGAYVKIFAIGAPYAPGLTLDPECSPGELNCTVDIGGGSSPWLTSGSHVYYNDGNVGIGTSAPEKKLSVLGGVLIQGGEVGVGGFALGVKDSVSVSTGLLSSIVVSGSKAYVTDSSLNSLSILDVSNPDNILFISSTNENLLSPISVAVSGNYAYVINSGLNLIVFNISDPNNIILVTSITNNLSNPRFITISGNHAFVADSGNGSVVILDISDPENILYVDSLQNEIEPISVAVSGNYVYVIDSSVFGAVNGGIFVFDISDINNIVPYAYADYINGVSNSIEGPNSIAILGNYAYVTNINNNTLVKIDISDPYNIFVEDTITTPYSQYGGVVVSGNYAYVGDSNDSLYAFDISNSSNITEADSINNNNIRCISDLAYQGGFVYAIDSCSDSLNIFSTGDIDGTSLDVVGGVAIGAYANNNNAPVNGLIVSGSVGIGTSLPVAKLDIGVDMTFFYNQDFIESDGMGDSLNDAVFSGSYTGTEVNSFTVVINSEGTPDTFSFSDDTGGCISQNHIPITGSPQLLCDGISIKFNSTTGHSLNDQWFYSVQSFSGSELAIKVSGGGSNYFIVNSIAENSNFLGDSAGYQAYDATSSNFLGFNAGYQANGSTDSNFLGDSAGYQAYNAIGSNFLGANAGYQATDAANSNFLGYNSGYGTSAYQSNFIGYNAGYQATDSTNSNFIGTTAGYQASFAQSSNFIGSGAGVYATNASNSNFIGGAAGESATNSQFSNFIGSGSGSGASQASHSTFIGNTAGYYATNSAYSVFIGEAAGNSATNASNSIFIGQLAGYNNTTLNNTNDLNDFSILIGKSTSTGGFSNSIAIGGSAVNTAANQFMIGSATRPINTTRWNGSASTQCTLTTGAGLACTSDERLKTNITDLPTDTLDKLIQVKTINFNWLEGNMDTNHIGFLAQDLEKYFPEIVATDSDGYKSVYYANMTPILAEAIRELDLKVKDFSSFDMENNKSFGYIIKNYLADVSNGFEIVFFGEVRTKKLCLEDLCIDKLQLEQLLNNNNLNDVDGSATNADDTGTTEGDSSPETDEENIEGGADADADADVGIDGVEGEEEASASDVVVSPPDEPSVENSADATTEEGN